MTPREPTYYLAFDLGASTGRAFLGMLEHNVLVMNELHRFKTPILEETGHLFWDIDVMWGEIKAGFEKALAIAPRLRSLSVDSWAVDYVSLDDAGDSIGNPYCYRDPRTKGVMSQVFDRISAEEIYDTTGIQFLPINTLFQLVADAQTGGTHSAPDVSGYLPIADFFNFRFSGRRAVEVSMASTTQLMDVHTRQWSAPLMEKCELDIARWPEIVPSGTLLGPANETPLVSVVASCSHDTGSAIAAAPAVNAGDDWAFISSGTWSLLGTERTEPLLSDDARECGFTNEAGLDGTIRLLKNLTGLWVLQECVREWQSTGAVDWADLEREARVSMAARGWTIQQLHSDGEESTSVFIDLEDDRFMARGPMEDRIHTYCRDYGLKHLESRGEIVLAVLSSIAESYRRTLSHLERITSRIYSRIHLFGGGSLNTLLCQLTANACKRMVVAGPVEAAAMGNLLIQARTMGDLPTGQSIRELAAESSRLEDYFPDPD